jgi:serine/threonine protein kinase
MNVHANMHTSCLVFLSCKQFFCAQKSGCLGWLEGWSLLLEGVVAVKHAAFAVWLQVDVYSFGVLLWEMLTGEVPWAGLPSPLQVIYYVSILNQRPAIPVHCPMRLRQLIEDCWQEVPASRPSFTHILHRLGEMKEEALPVVPAGKHGSTVQESAEGQEEHQCVEEQQQDETRNFFPPSDSGNGKTGCNAGSCAESMESMGFSSSPLP